MKVTNKLLNQTEQGNIIIDTDYYTQEEIIDMFCNEECFYINDRVEVSYDCEGFITSLRYGENKALRISLDNITDINVELDNFKRIANFATANNGKKYKVIL